MEQIRELHARTQDRRLTGLRSAGTVVGLPLLATASAGPGFARVPAAMPPARQSPDTLNRHSGRFQSGFDRVVPDSPEQQHAMFEMYDQ